MAFINKKESNHKSEKIETSSIEQLAKQLGIPDELLQHHQFLVALKSFICSVCNHSNNPLLKNLTYRKRIDLEFPTNINLSKDEMEKLSSEIRNLKWLQTPEITSWLKDTYPESQEVKSHTAMVINSENKSVCFQDISKSGANVYRAPQIVSFTRYSTDEKGNLISDVLSQYEDYSTKSRKITSKDNKTLKSTAINYDKDGNITGSISQDGEDIEKS